MLNPNPASSRLVLHEGGDSRNPADYVRQYLDTGSCPPNSLAAPGLGVCIAGSILHKTNTNRQTDLRTSLESRHLYADGVFDISDDMRFRANMLYSKRESDRTVAGYPMQAAPFDTPLLATS